ncbi:thiamine pyrophosphate-dependent enzyme [Paraburkholderia oxyphila]|uniref:thiamine pyrophosphate-dependent enzyme n=1 Tax=Paraburkholderia oxyphila TaxID=614212 RepID=UPI000AE2A140|nr:thiamine pyrophosphate-dependent enzyme [Paraburkholderia oxyphila]
MAMIDRRRFVAQVMADVPDALVVTGLGSPSYDVFAAGDRAGNFYLWGAMGGAAAMGLGLALAQPQKSVLVVTGDGEQLMGIGALGTIGAKQPKNLTIVVLDNGHYGETGMQQSHSSLGTDMVAVSKGFGIADSFAVWKETDYSQVVERVKARQGTSLAQVHIRADEPPRALPSRDGVYIKNRFRAGLGFQPF